MKKWIATAVAAGALAAGGAASAQDIGGVIANILGFGQPQYGQTQQGVVGQTYQDQYGRQFYYDQYGRQVYVQNTQQITGYDQWGRPVYGNSQQQIVGYDQWGRPVYGNSGQYAYGARNRDRDGDGVVNRQDRYPDDPRYR